MSTLPTLAEAAEAIKMAAVCVDVGAGVMYGGSVEAESVEDNESIRPTELDEEVECGDVVLVFGIG